MKVHEFGNCLCGQAASGGKAVYSRDIHMDPRCIQNECKHAGMMSFAALPLMSASRAIGILGLASALERDFQTQSTFLEALSHEVAIGLQNALLYENAQADARELEVRLVQIQQAEQEKERLMVQLQHAQKMEAIGTLAGGITHDFNNILTKIIMGSEMLEIQIHKTHTARALVEKILSAAIRAKDLVQHILTFSRQSDLETHPIQVAPIIKDTIKMARAILPATIEIRQNFSFSNDVISANPTQIHQVIMNLITNAAHAMRSNGGNLSFDLHNEEVSDPARAVAQGIRTGSYLKLRGNHTGSKSAGQRNGHCHAVSGH